MIYLLREINTGNKIKEKRDMRKEAEVIRVDHLPLEEIKKVREMKKNQRNLQILFTLVQRD
jgi:hypothetical protein